MSNGQLFAVTSEPGPRIDLRPGERRTVVFNVQNISGRTLEGRAGIKAGMPAHEPWYTIQGKTERRFGDQEVHQYVVEVAVPEDAPGGRYTFELECVWVDRPDEGFGRSDKHLVVVSAANGNGVIPWWVWLVAGLAVVAVGGLIAWFLLRGDPETGDVVLLDHDPSLTRHLWIPVRGRAHFLDDELYPYRAGVTHVEDMPPAGESRILLTYDLAVLQGRSLVSAGLDLAFSDVIGRPFEDHPYMVLEEVSFGDLSQAIASPPLRVLERFRSRPTEPLDISEALAESIERGARRFQLRILFDGISFPDIDAALAARDSYVEWEGIPPIRATVR